MKFSRAASVLAIIAALLPPATSLPFESRSISPFKPTSWLYPATPEEIDRAWRGFGKAPKIRRRGDGPGVCDRTCTYHILFEAAFSGASTGIDYAMRVYNAGERCYGQEREFCPQILESKTTAIASRSAYMEIDYHACDQACLLLAMNEVSRRGALYGMQLVDIMFGDQNTSANPAELEKLHWTMWYLSYNTGSVDLSTLPKIANSTSSSNATRSSNSSMATAAHNVTSITNQTGSLGSSGSYQPMNLLVPYVNEGACHDPYICEDGNRQAVSDTLKNARSAINGTTWLGFMLAGGGDPNSPDPKRTFPKWTTQPPCDHCPPPHRVETQRPPPDWTPQRIPDPPQNPNAPEARQPLPEFDDPLPDVGEPLHEPLPEFEPPAPDQAEEEQWQSERTRKLDEQCRDNKPCRDALGKKLDEERARAKELQGTAPEFQDDPPPDPAEEEQWRSERTRRLDAECGNDEPCREALGKKLDEERASKKKPSQGPESEFQDDPPPDPAEEEQWRSERTRRLDAECGNDEPCREALAKKLDAEREEMKKPRPQSEPEFQDEPPTQADEEQWKSERTRILDQICGDDLPCRDNLGKKLDKIRARKLSQPLPEYDDLPLDVGSPDTNTPQAEWDDVPPGVDDPSQPPWYPEYDEPPPDVDDRTGEPLPEPVEDPLDQYDEEQWRSDQEWLDEKERKLDDLCGSDPDCRKTKGQELDDQRWKDRQPKDPAKPSDQEHSPDDIKQQEEQRKLREQREEWEKRQRERQERERKIREDQNKATEDRWSQNREEIQKKCLDNDKCWLAEQRKRFDEQMKQYRDQRETERKASDEKDREHVCDNEDCKHEMHDKQEAAHENQQKKEDADHAQQKADTEKECKGDPECALDKDMQNDAKNRADNAVKKDRDDQRKDHIQTQCDGNIQCEIKKGEDLDKKRQDIDNRQEKTKADDIKTKNEQIEKDCPPGDKHCIEVKTGNEEAAQKDELRKKKPKEEAEAPPKLCLKSRCPPKEELPRKPGPHGQELDPRKRYRTSHFDPETGKLKVGELRFHPHYREEAFTDPEKVPGVSKYRAKQLAHDLNFEPFEITSGPGKGRTVWHDMNDVISLDDADMLKAGDHWYKMSNGYFGRDAQGNIIPGWPKGASPRAAEPVKKVDIGSEKTRFIEYDADEPINVKPQRTYQKKPFDIPEDSRQADLVDWKQVMNVPKEEDIFVHDNSRTAWHPEDHFVPPDQKTPGQLNPSQTHPWDHPGDVPGPSNPKPGPKPAPVNDDVIHHWEHINDPAKPGPVKPNAKPGRLDDNIFPPRNWPPGGMDGAADLDLLTNKEIVDLKAGKRGKLPNPAKFPKIANFGGITRVARFGQTLIRGALPSGPVGWIVFFGAMGANEFIMMSMAEGNEDVYFHCLKERLNPFGNHQCGQVDANGNEVNGEDHGPWMNFLHNYYGWLIPTDIDGDGEKEDPFTMFVASMQDLGEGIYDFFDSSEDGTGVVENTQEFFVNGVKTMVHVGQAGWSWYEEKVDWARDKAEGWIDKVPPIKDVKDKVKWAHGKKECAEEKVEGFVDATTDKIPGVKKVKVWMNEKWGDVKDFLGVKTKAPKSHCK